MYPQLLLAYICLNSALGARILAFVPLPFFSHQYTYRPLWKELSLRGHQVVLITTDPIRNESLVNLTEIDLHGAYSIFPDQHSVLEKYSLYDFSKLYTYLDNFISVSNAVMDYEVRHPEVQKLLRNRNESFDLVIGEFLLPEVIAFAFRFDCPFIGVHSMDPYYIPYAVMGNTMHPVLYPFADLGYTEDLSFSHRLKSVLYTFFMRYYVMYYLGPLENERMKKYFQLGLISQEEFYDTVCMLFVNANRAFCNVRALVPSTVNVAQGIHIEEAKELPKVT